MNVASQPVQMNLVLVNASALTCAKWKTLAGAIHLLLKKQSILNWVKYLNKTMQLPVIPLAILQC